MLKIACFCFAIAVAMPLWSQVEPSASGGGFSLDDDHMMTPPPVSGDASPVGVGAEGRKSNYLAGGIVVTGGYNDNILAGGSTQKIGDSNYSLIPTIALNRQTPRQSASLSWSSGFQIYQKSSELNGATQDGSAAYSFHLSPYAVVHVEDAFNQNSNLYNKSNPFSTGAISGGTPSPTAVYLFPFDNEIGNSTSGGVEYQYGRNAMIGGSGNYSFTQFSAGSNSVALDDLNIDGASAFWSRRMTRGQYTGISYTYSNITTHPLKSTTDVHTIFGFYTMYLTRTVSLSVLGGPQHYISTDPVSGMSAGSWGPAIQGSFGYQKPRTAFSANWSHIVSSVGGLIGAYHSDIGILDAQRRIARTWNIEMDGSYALFKNAAPAVSSFNAGGHTIMGTVSVDHSINEHIHLDIGYSHFHQSYSNFGTVTQLFPDSNREFASVSYQFSRPIGR